MAQSTKRSRESPESSSSSTTTTTSSSVKRCRIAGARTIGNDVLCHLMTFLEIDALKIVVFLSRSMRDTVHSYFAILLQKSTFHISTMEMIKRGDQLFHRDFPNLDKAMEMLEILSTLPGYDSSKKVKVKLGRGIHEVVGSCDVPGFGTQQKTISVSCDNLSFVGQGQGKTTVQGSFVVLNGRKAHVADLTVKNPTIGFVLVAYGMGTEMDLQNVTSADSQYHGVVVWNSAKLVAAGCHFHQNGYHGVCVSGSTTTARLTNCTSHHNKGDGVYAYSGAVVDLMGEGTSVHDNERHGLSSSSRGTTINVYQPCVLNDTSHGNKGQNINRAGGGTVQQKDSKK